VSDQAVFQARGCALLEDETIPASLVALRKARAWPWGTGIGEQYPRSPLDAKDRRLMERRETPDKRIRHSERQNPQVLVRLWSINVKGSQGYTTWHATMWPRSRHRPCSIRRSSSKK